MNAQVDRVERQTSPPLTVHPRLTIYASEDFDDCVVTLPMDPKLDPPENPGVCPSYLLFSKLSIIKDCTKDSDGKAKPRDDHPASEAVTAVDSGSSPGPSGEKASSPGIPPKRLVVRVSLLRKSEASKLTILAEAHAIQA